MARLGRIILGAGAATGSHICLTDRFLLSLSIVSAEAVASYVTGIDLLLSANVSTMRPRYDRSDLAPLLRARRLGECRISAASILARITGTSKGLQLLRYPRSKPICATRPVSEHGQPHMRSPLVAAAPRSRFRRAGLRKTRTILESGISVPLRRRPSFVGRFDLT